MIAVTADVLLAYLIEGDSEPARKAAAFIESVVEEGEQIYVTHGVLGELALELVETHGLTWMEVDPLIRKLLSTAQLCVEDRDVAFEAVVAWMDEGSYANRILHRRAFVVGCRDVATLDRRLRHGFRQL